MVDAPAARLEIMPGVKEWEIPDVSRTEIGETKGRPKSEKSTVKEWFSWILKEKAPEIILALQDEGDIPPPADASPEEKRKEKRAKQTRSWQENFDKQYPAVTAEETEQVKTSDVICLAALGRNSSDWKEDVDYLREKLGDGTHVVVIDVPEIGSPIEGTNYKHTFESLTDFVRFQIAQLEEKGELGHGKKTIVGHSKGGLIAAHLAVNDPDNVANIICLSSPFKPEGRPAAPWMLPLLNKLSYMNLDGIFDFMKERFGINRGKINSMLEKVTVRNCLDTYLELLNYGWDKLLKKIHPEIGFVATKGRNDGFLDSGGYEGSMIVPNATIIGFPEFGHNMPPAEILFRILMGEQKKLELRKASV